MGFFVLVILVVVIVVIVVRASKPNKEEEARKCFYRGCTYIKNEDYDLDLAINYFTQAIQLNPNHFDAHLLRAEMYEKKGDYDKAIADRNEMVRINPEISIYGRGCLYIKIGDIKKAIADFEETLRYNPNHAGAKDMLKEARQKLAST